MKFTEVDVDEMIQSFPIAYIGSGGAGYGSVGCHATDDAGKIFVGGIPPDADKVTLTEYFKKFGEVADCVIMVDNVTQRSRGFGFVTFADPCSVNNVITNHKHVINGKVVDAKKAVPKGPNQSSILRQMGVTSNRADRNPECKIFVGGIAQGTVETDLHNHFSDYGKVLEVKIPKDQETQRARGFAFVLFEGPGSVQASTEERYHRVNGKMVEVKGVQVKPQTPHQTFDRPDEDRTETSSPYATSSTDSTSTRGYSPLSLYQNQYYRSLAAGQYYSQYDPNYLASYTQQLSLDSPLYEQSSGTSQVSISSSSGYSSVPVQSASVNSGVTEYPSSYVYHDPVAYSMGRPAHYGVSPVALSATPPIVSGGYTPPIVTGAYTPPIVSAGTYSPAGYASAADGGAATAAAIYGTPPAYASVMHGHQQAAAAAAQQPHYSQTVAPQQQPPPQQPPPQSTSPQPATQTYIR